MIMPSAVRLCGWSERTQVRLASRILALAVFALFAALLSQRISTAPSTQAGAAGAPAAAILVDVTPRADARSIRRPPQPSTITIAAAEPSHMEGDGALRLWIDGPSGEVIFRDAEQFQRCLEARSQRAVAPDCPSRNDRRVMVLAEGGAPRFRF